ncbi:MAG: xanthine dehydrogenase molybdopterin binding subunit [Leptospiraceae bacterium]|nr:xanthine dehydrogenase molybdopterin binding subunit [Leptospiraceae bacterium]
MASNGVYIPHESAKGHVTGQAHYIDDLPRLHAELYVGYLGSPVAHGKILSINLDKAKKIPGVVGIYTHKDIQGENLFGPIIKDEKFLAYDVTHFLSEPICVIAGEYPEAIEKAKAAIELEIEELEPILSIDKAIEKQKFIGKKIKIERGDTSAGFAASDHILEGSFITGGQEQFYLESQIAFAIPQEENDLLIYSSTQNPTEIQKVVAEVLGLGHHEVVCICKRMGGAFGGKETQGVHVALMAALVAQKTRRPARCGYDKDTDMKVTGKRHPYKSFYKMGYSQDGEILALEIDYYSDGGCTADLSPSVLSRTLMHTDNAYFLPNIRTTGQICYTNFPSNTAFRGFGGPQGVAAIENLIEEIAIRLGKDSLEIRKKNLYGPGRETTPYGQIVRNNILPNLIERLVTESDYHARLAEIQEYNRSSKLNLKGIALTPVKFGISFTTKFLNQGNALVNIYTDGTVQVSSGGTEMGQGLYTKLRQIVADQFAIPVEDVKVMATSTEKNNNASPTAASAGTDLNGNAAVNACEKIRERLAGFAATLLADQAAGISPEAAEVCFDDAQVFDRRLPDKKISFKELVIKAYKERISLGERGFYATPGIDFNNDTGKGNPFYYFTNGAAVTEVLIDRFTGELKLEKIDVLMDIGNSINPGIDHGQITGGVVQGLGWATNEALTYNEKGELLSHSPTTYKIPGIKDIPLHFNVNFFDNPEHQINVLRSKAVAEPPLMLGISAFCAVKNALSSVLGTSGANINLPATGEEILMALQKTGVAKMQS